MTLVPFTQDLNRFRRTAKNVTGKQIFETRQVKTLSLKRARACAFSARFDARRG
jgi:hypothetical protein